MYKKYFVLICLILVQYSFVVAQDKSSDQEKLHLIRCDDIGMCHSVNVALEKVIETGIPISASVMFTCPWYQEAVDILKEHPKVSVGIHLTLNAEWKNYRWGPILGREAVPSLVDSFGYFFPSRTKLFQNNPKLNELERELRAQVVRAVNTGLQIDYIDYHMGAAVQTLELREIVESLAKEFGLGIVQYFGEKYSSVTYRAAIGAKTDSLVHKLKNLEPGINLQVIHIGLDNSEMQAMKDLNPTGPTDMSSQRADELKTILSPELKRALADYKIKSVTYRDVIKKFGLENMKRPDVFD